MKREKERRGPEQRSYPNTSWIGKYGVRGEKVSRKIIRRETETMMRAGAAIVRVPQTKAGGHA
jgi:hypothetical protein